MILESDLTQTPNPLVTITIERLPLKSSPMAHVHSIYLNSSDIKGPIPLTGYTYSTGQQNSIRYSLAVTTEDLQIRINSEYPKILQFYLQAILNSKDVTSDMINKEFLEYII